MQVLDDVSKADAALNNIRMRMERHVVSAQGQFAPSLLLLYSPHYPIATPGAPKLQPRSVCTRANSPGGRKS